MRDITDELPFDVPESWEWVRLGQIMNVVSARRVQQSDWKKSGIPFYRAREIARLSESGNVDNELFISQELYDEFSKSGVPHVGDLMVTAVGTIGKTYVVRLEDVFYYKDASVVCFENYAGLCSLYMKFLIEAPCMVEQIKDNSAGTTVDTITIIKANQYLIPLPPLAEQHRIVERIEQILPHIADYDTAEQKLTALNAAFPDQLKKSILQAAVQGKLVPQDENDEPASALLERIRAERERLIREGKIKRGKHESIIFRRDNSHYEKLGDTERCIDDEIPFDLPDNWAWARFSTIVSYSMGKTPPRKETEYWVHPAHSWVSIADMVGDGVIASTKEAVSDYASVETFKGRKSIAGTLLMSFKLTVGKVSILGIDAYHNEAIISIYPFANEKAIKMYLFKILPLISQGGNTKSAIKGNTLNSESIDALLVPLPPLSEQNRIVERIEQLMTTTKSL